MDADQQAIQVTDFDITASNYTIYRDALAAVLIDKLAEPDAKPKKKRRQRRAKPADEPVADDSPDLASPDDMAEFVDYLARETFDLLPHELQTLAHHVWVADAQLRLRFAGNDDKDKVVPAASVTAPQVTELMPGLDPSPAADSMQAYGLTGRGGGWSAADLVARALSAYLQAVTTPPPVPRTTRDAADGCAICGREHIDLSYHHLIPRSVHAKAVKHGWHRPDELQNVAWLCGACHRRVHQFASHEDLARHYYTVERLMAAPAMQRYAAWASRLRWKKK